MDGNHLVLELPRRNMRLEHGVQLPKGPALRLGKPKITPDEGNGAHAATAAAEEACLASPVGRSRVQHVGHADSGRDLETAAQARAQCDCLANAIGYFPALQL